MPSCSSGSPKKIRRALRRLSGRSAMQRLAPARLKLAETKGKLPFSQAKGHLSFSRLHFLHFSLNVPASSPCIFPSPMLKIPSVVQGKPCRGVAQPGSAPASGAGGRRFKSSRPDHLKSTKKATSKEVAFLNLCGNFYSGCHLVAVCPKIEPLRLHLSK
jgi:hypothetical protein